MKQHSDTGIEVELLQEYIFVTLDNFIKVLHNKDGKINNKLEAWLTFLSSDELEDIVRLIIQYPQFRTYYEEVYRMCLEVEKIMGLFSEELAILDSNTVDYMMDEMQEEIDTLKDEKAALGEEKISLEKECAALEEEKSALEEEKSALEEEKSILEYTNMQLVKDAERKNKLMKCLADAGRVDDIRAVLTDINHQEKLYKEFNL